MSDENEVQVQVVIKPKKFPKIKKQTLLEDEQLRLSMIEVSANPVAASAFYEIREQPASPWKKMFDGFWDK